MHWKYAAMGIGALAAILGTTAGAEAVQGCGPGWYRNYWGVCRPGAVVQGLYGYGPRFYGGPRVVVVGPRYGYGWRGRGWRHRHW